MSPGERVYRRSDQQVIQEEISSKFHPRQWYISRYSDSTWPVLYSAETEETALRESLFHKRKFYWEELKRKSIQLDLRIAALEVTSDRCQDLLQTKGLDETKLISNDESGYPYCQALAKYYRERGADLFRTPSARHEKGICIPIFAIEVITQDKGHLKYAKCVLRSEGAEVFEGKFSIYF